MAGTGLADKLTELIKLDIDAVHCYDQAIKEIDVQMICDRLTDFRNDHERHVSDLSMIIRGLGLNPPELTPDFKGYLLEGITAIQSAMGTGSALKAMRMNEELTNKAYGRMVSTEFPPDVKDAIERNYADEKNHLAYIEEVLKSESWKTATRKSA